MMEARWRCSTTTMTAVMTRTVPSRNWAWSDMNLNRGSLGLTSGSRPGVEPDLPERDVRVAQPVHLHAPDIRLEEPLVGVVPDRHDRSVIEDELLSLAVEARLARQVPLPLRLEEELIDHRVRVSREVPGAARVEELEQEVVRVRHIGKPCIEEHRELALREHRRERGPVRLVVELGLDSHRRQVLLDLRVLLQELLELHTGPDLDRGETAPARVSGQGKEIPGSLRVIGVT